MTERNLSSNPSRTDIQSTDISREFAQLNFGDLDQVAEILKVILSALRALKRARPQPLPPPDPVIYFCPGCGTRISGPRGLELEHSDCHRDFIEMGG